MSYIFAAEKVLHVFLYDHDDPTLDPNWRYLVPVGGIASVARVDAISVNAILTNGETLRLRHTWDDLKTALGASSAVVSAAGGGAPPPAAPAGLTPASGGLSLELSTQVGELLVPISSTAYIRQAPAVPGDTLGQTIAMLRNGQPLVLNHAWVQAYAAIPQELIVNIAAKNW